MEEKILSVKNLTIVRNDHKILDDLSFDVAKGDTLAVIGPNGAGKTTLLKAILGLIPYVGQVTWGKDVKIGYVPQRLYLENDIPFTTKEFLELKHRGINEIKKALKSVGLGGEEISQKETEKHILENKISNLSGGELQRVLIAWSLLGNPNVLLFDEPTSGIDISGEDTVYTLLSELNKKAGLTIILVSHEIDVVRHFTSQVLCLNKEKVCYGPPQEVITQKTIDKLFGGETDYYHHNHKF